jgi:hypothetical protein
MLIAAHCPIIPKKKKRKGALLKESRVFRLRRKMMIPFFYHKGTVIWLQPYREKQDTLRKYFTTSMGVAYKRPSAP